MKNYEITPALLKAIQQKLDERFGKKIIHALALLLLCSCLSLVVSCESDKKAEKIEQQQREAEAKLELLEPRSEEVKITIEDTSQRSAISKMAQSSESGSSTCIVDAYFAEKENNSTPKHYKKISKSALGKEIYIIVDTINLVGREVSVNVLDIKKVIADKEFGVLSIQQDGKDVNGLLKAKVREDGYAIFTVILKPGKDDKDQKTLESWRVKIGAAPDNKLQLCLLVSVEPEPNETILYCGTNPSDHTGGKNESNYWLDTEEKWFDVNAENGNLYLLIAGAMRTGNNLIGDVTVQVEKEYFDRSRDIEGSYAAVAGGFGNGAPENGAYTVTNYADRSPTGWYNAGMNNNSVGFSFNLNPTFDTGRTDLRLHPDGNNEGTLGCVGLSGDNNELTQFRDLLRNALDRNGTIQATINIDNNPNNNGRSGRRLPNVNE